MDPRLKKLISDYQARVAAAVDCLERAGIPRPASDTEWACNEAPESAQLADGVEFRKHGYGCAVWSTEWSVNFDFGEHGEIDGFEGYKLWAFARARTTSSDQFYGFASAQEIEQSIKASVECGDIRHSGYILYYVAKPPRT